MENSLCKDRLSTLLFLKWHSKTAGDSDRGKSLGACDKPQMAPLSLLETQRKAFPSRSNAKRKRVNETISNVFWYCKHTCIIFKHSG